MHQREVAQLGGDAFQLADGHLVRGPSMYDQPAYDVRPGVPSHHPS